MKYLFTLLAFVLTFSSFAQNRVYDMVMQEQESLDFAPSFDLFGVTAESADRNNQLSDVLREGTILQLDVLALDAAKRTGQTTMRMNIPRSDGRDFELELIETNILAEDFDLFTSLNPNEPIEHNPGKHYMGIVRGERNSVVSISLFDHHLVGMINTNEGNFVLGKLENTRDQYILYNDKSLIPEFDLGCQMPDDGRGYTVEELTPSHSRDAGDCVRIYVEVHEDITANKGNATNAAAYVEAVFAQSAILYANDGITIVISEMFVWETTSPYTSGSTSTLLGQFQSNVGSFNGDLGHLVGYAGGGGIAAGFNGICNSNPDNSMCYSGIQSSYADVPTYSWTVMVVTHEMGHLFGSRHTHACVWNGNNTAIDGCAGGTEGSCSLPGNPPGGGTIMSYCHQTSVGINLNNGFGPQPSAVVNNNVNNGSCLSPCSSPTCTTPDGLSTTGIGDNVATLNWNSVSTADDYTLQWRESGTSSWTTQTTSGTSYGLSGLSEGTGHDWHVRANCPDGSSSYSSIASFTTTGTPPVQYCSTQGSNASLEWIAGVSVANLTNNTGSNGGYANFTGLSADLDEGSNYSFALTPGFSSTVYTENWSIWIDYNGDADFDDAGELVAQAVGNSVVNPSFTVPSSVPVSSTRMRVSMKWNGYSTPCETFSYGEVEDYTVNIDGTPPPTCDVPGGLSSSSITENSAVLSWSSVANAIDYTVQLRVQGSPTWDVEADIAGTSANATNLISGTIYEWHVRSNCAGGSSAYSPIAAFTTEQSTGGCTYETINFNNFEGGWGIWNDGGSDCRRSNKDASYALGTYCVRLRDNNSTGTMSTDNMNLSSYDEITVDFSYYPRSMDNSNEDFWLQISENGGSSYSTVEEWNLNDEFTNNARYYDQVVITGPFSSTTRLRFRCDASGNSDWIYVDEVDITGCNNAALHNPTIEPVSPVVTEEYLAFDQEEDFESVVNEEDIMVYPNPTSDVLNIEFRSYQPQQVELLLTATNGQLIFRQQKEVTQGLEDLTLDVAQASPGLYALTLVTKNNVYTKMVIIQ